MTIKTKEIRVSLSQLMLDPNNYRLNRGEDWESFSDDQIIESQAMTQKKLVKENISDLETSILKNGFLEVDKIVVKELNNISENSDLKKYIVIEGNRRTAAFKSIISEYYIEGKESFEEGFPQSLEEKYNKINVILVEGSTEEIIDYSQRLMGIRHVSGPRQWGGYQSAKLINDMVSQGYKKIGTLLGMRPSDAQRKHEAYLAIQQMKKDPDYSEKANPKLFTLFAEMVAANKFFKESWLGWNKEHGVFENTKNLHRIYNAILPDENGDKEVNNPSRLRSFATSIKTPEVREQLESGIHLDEIDFDFDLQDRIKSIKSFTNFTKKLNVLSDEERQLFVTLEMRIHSLLKTEEE